jgi:hypothetical protein
VVSVKVNDLPTADVKGEPVTVAGLSQSESWDGRETSFDVAANRHPTRDATRILRVSAGAKDGTGRDARLPRSRNVELSDGRCLGMQREAANARPFLVIIRGPIGAGKTTLMRELERDRALRFWALDTDGAAEFHPGDPTGEWLDQEWDPEIDLLALHAKLVLGRGLNLVMDPGLLLTAAKVDRFLRRVRRKRSDPKVVLFRLVVTTPEAVKRKTTLKPQYVRASHKGWITRPVRGEVVIETNGKTPRQIASVARKVLRERIATEG